MASLQVSIDAAWLTSATAKVFANALEGQLASPKLRLAWKRLRKDKPLEFITCCLMEATPDALHELRRVCGLSSNNLTEPRALDELTHRYLMQELKLTWSDSYGFRLALIDIPPVSKDELQVMVDTILKKNALEEEHRLTTPARDYVPLGDELLEVVYGAANEAGRMVQPITPHRWGFVGRTPHGYRSYRWEHVKAARQARHPGHMTDLPMVTVTLSGGGKQSHFSCDVLLEGTYSFGR